MAFDPTQFGATPVGSSTSFDPSQFGATPVSASVAPQSLQAPPQSLPEQLWGGLAGIGKSIAQPLVSLAATPVQAGVAIANKLTGGHIPDPYANGALGGINVSPLGLEQKTGDALKAGAEVAGVAAAPATIPGAIAAGAGIGAAQMGGGAMQQGASAKDVTGQALLGGAIGGVAGGAVSGIAKLLGSAGDKIMTSVIKPTKPDIADGFNLQTLKDFNLGGSLNTTLEKTQSALGDLTSQLNAKLQGSTAKVDLNNVLNDTVAELTDGSKLKGFGANVKIQNTLQSLKDEIGLVNQEGGISIPDAQVIKQSAGNFGAWQWGKPDPESKATEIVYNTFYNKLKTAIEQNSPEGVKEINQQLGKLIPVQNAVLRRLPVAERSNLVSLNEMIGLVGSTMHPAALGPTILNLISRSGAAGSLLSKFGPSAARLAAPAALGASAIGSQAAPIPDTGQAPLQ